MVLMLINMFCAYVLKALSLYPIRCLEVHFVSHAFALYCRCIPMAAIEERSKNRLWYAVYSAIAMTKTNKTRFKLFNG